MKKALSTIACLCLALGLFGCGQKPQVKSTIQGNMKTYSELSDGTWLCEDTAYAYRLEISGRMPHAAADSVYVYLSNKPEISFDEAWKASGFSSSTDDYFSADEAVLVEWHTEA